MRLLKQSLLVAVLVAGVSFTCAAQSADSAAIREHSQTIARAINEARPLIQPNPREALAMLERVYEAELPLLDFDSDDFNTVSASYDLWRNMAFLYREAAMAADYSGHWEKAADYYRKSAEAIKEPAEKAKTAFVRFSENIDKNVIQLRELMNSDEIKQLKAKNENDYTNDDYTLLERLQFFENELKANQDYEIFFKSRSEAVDRDVANFNPEQSREALMLEKIKQVKDQIDTYKGGRGNTVKWVDAIVRNHENYMRNYPSQEDKIAFVYRLIVLSPNDKRAPVLLDFLKGNTTKAELDRVIKQK